MTESDMDYRASEPVFPLTSDPQLMRWRASLNTLWPSRFKLREGSEDPTDARRLKDLQLECEPITVQTVQHNATTIADNLVLLAEIGTVHVGFCIASIGSVASRPTFIKVVAVAPATTPGHSDGVPHVRRCAGAAAGHRFRYTRRQ